MVQSMPTPKTNWYIGLMIKNTIIRSERCKLKPYKKNVNIQNYSLRFFQILFQSSNFAFVHFNHLSFGFIQLRHFRQLLLKFFEKEN